MPIVSVGCDRQISAADYRLFDLRGRCATVSDNDRRESTHALELLLPVAILAFLFANRSGKHTVFGNDHIESQVNGKHTFAENGALTSALTAVR